MKSPLEYDKREREWLRWVGAKCACVGVEKIFAPRETKKSASVRNAFCKEYASKEGTASDGITDTNRVKSCLEPASEKSASRVILVWK